MYKIFMPLAVSIRLSTHRRYGHQDTVGTTIPNSLWLADDRYDQPAGPYVHGSLAEPFER
jgi:hypothetical protein